MPVYNAERYLKQSIESILDQSFRDFEFIIVSEPGTNIESTTVIRSYHDPRIRHIRNTRRLGYPGSLNVGIKEARGEYVALQDADDISSRVRLERQVNFLDNHPRVGVVGSWFEVIDEKGKAISQERPPIESAMIKWRLLFRCPIANPSAMVRHTVYDELKGYDVQFPVASDYEFWTRASQVTEFRNLADTLLRYRTHGASLSHANEQAVYQATLEISKKAIANVLGKRVPAKLLGALARPSSTVSSRDYLDATGMFHDLCLQYASQIVVSPTERSLILRDGVRTLFAHAIHCMKKNAIFSLLIGSIAVRLALEGKALVTPLRIIHVGSGQHSDAKGAFQSMESVSPDDAKNTSAA